MLEINQLKVYKVAIVEDDFIISLLLEKQVNKIGYEVAGKASSAEEGLKMIKSEKPDVILMDIKINGEYDGIQLMEKVRDFSDARVIYLTGNTDSSTRKRADLTNPSGYLVKPVELSLLRDTIMQAAQN